MMLSVLMITEPTNRMIPMMSPSNVVMEMKFSEARVRLDRWPML